MSKKWDLAIDGGWVLTQDENRTAIRDGLVCIDGESIVYVGERRDSLLAQAERVIDARDKIVLPGLVNAHCHCQHDLMRGGASDGNLSTLEWLHNALHPAMSAYEQEDSYAAAQLYCLEALRSGITTTMENADYSAIDHVYNEGIRAYRESGLRFVYGDVFADRYPPMWEGQLEIFERRTAGRKHLRPPFPVRSTEESLARIRRRMQQNHAEGGRVTVAPAPMFPLVNTTEGLLAARDLAAEFQTPVLIHAGIERADRQFGLSDVELLDAIGFLGPRILLAHMLDVDSRDISLLARRGSGIAYCPVSNAWGSHGVAPVRDYLNAGIPVGIGTDDPNANQSANILSDLRVGALVQSLRYGASAVTAQEMLDMATIEGMRTVGMDDRLGSLEEGKIADLIMLDTLRPNLVPMQNPVSAIVYQALGSEVDTVIVGGEVLLEQGQSLKLDEEAILGSAGAASARVLTRAGMAPS